MNLGDTLLLGVNTTIVCMAIVFIILIVLSIIIILQSKILKLLTNQDKSEDKVNENQLEVKVRPEVVSKAPVMTGSTKGQAKLVGLESEEHVAIIMAAVSDAANIPITALKIRSIKRVDNA